MLYLSIFKIYPLTMAIHTRVRFITWDINLELGYIFQRPLLIVEQLHCILTFWCLSVVCVIGLLSDWWTLTSAFIFIFIMKLWRVSIYASLHLFCQYTVADPELFIRGREGHWLPLDGALYTHVSVIPYIINQIFPTKGRGPGIAMKNYEILSKTQHQWIALQSIKQKI